jgi:hypothetical protein
MRGGSAIGISGTMEWSIRAEPWTVARALTQPTGSLPPWSGLSACGILTNVRDYGFPFAEVCAYVCTIG